MTQAFKELSTTQFEASSLSQGDGRRREPPNENSFS